MNETRQLARWLADLRYDDLPKNVVDLTKRIILDDLGCMIGGALQLGNKCVLRDVLGSGECPDCTVAYYGHRTSAPTAALVNGAFIAGWDYDSMAQGGGYHMGSQTAALLALAERQLVDGRTMVLAECAGIEAQCAIGSSAQVRHGGISGGGAHPWHSNATLGPFAAAVTTGKILGFDAVTMEDAIALACSSLGGNYQHYFSWGSSMKRVRCGIGAWSGVRAALLAAEGLTGPAESLEGASGWLEAMVGRDGDGTPWFDASRLVEGLGVRWLISTYNTKAGGCGCVSSLLSPVLTAAALRSRHAFSIDQIDSVTVEFKVPMGLHESAQNRGAELGDTPEQRLGTSGWSLEWMVAEALVVGLPGIREQLNNIRPYGSYREIEQLAGKVVGTVNREYYEKHFHGIPHEMRGGRVLLRMKDGSLLEHEPVPYPGCRMSDGSINTITREQLRTKYREQASVAGFSEEKQDRAIQIVENMEDVIDVRELLSVLVR
jgi:2-methylcitrate dehydratase PrpD